MNQLFRLAALALLGLGLAAPQAHAQQPPAAKNIDVVICLDVSGSMGGLIDSAKTKLWDIVNQLAKIKPVPNLRVGLYSYGSPRYGAQTGYVRKEMDLSTDLDLLYQKLFALTINGGDEYVARVSLAAVEQQKWNDAEGTLKIIFVCGNEPANQDPQVTMKQAAERAVGLGIVINAVFCGNADASDATSWREFAALAGGRFAAIDHNRGTVVVATPFDKKLAELGGKLNTTYIAYGKDGLEKAANQQAQTENAKKLGLGVAASRTASQNSGIYRNEGWDLVDKMKAEPNFDVAKVPADQLCEDLRKLTPEQRVGRVKEMSEQRSKLQKEIADLTVQREAHLRLEARRNPDQANRGFDAAIQEALRTQAAARGIVIPKEE